MAILTTLIVPPFLPMLVRRAEAAPDFAEEGGPAAGIEDDDGVVESVPHAGHHDGHHDVG
jgi:hypothetical protein